MSGTFVTFEGVDGSGKSTLIGRVAEKLAASGLSVLTTFEPGDTPVGAVLRAEALKADLSPEAELMLFACDRAEHVRKVVRPALLRGDIVLCDRYDASNIAYQGAWRGLGETTVADISTVAAGGTRPHLTFWVDVPENVSRARRATPVNGMDVAAADAYDLISGSYRARHAQDPTWIRLDGCEDVERLAEQAAEHVRTLHTRRSRRGTLLLLVGPSGSGKNTLANSLLGRGDVDYVLSATTRAAREGERDGVDYLFVDDPTFDSMVRDGDLAEHTEYAGRRYGTVARTLNPEDGRHKIAIVELAGARAIRTQHPDAIVAFLRVDEDTLRDRLTRRNSESPETLEERLAVARHELMVGPNYADIILEAGDLPTMVSSVGDILGSVR